MRHNALETILGYQEIKPILFENLMPKRIQNILLVSSLYDSYTFVEDGNLTDIFFSEYSELNLRYRRESTTSRLYQKRCASWKRATTISSFPCSGRAT